MKGSKLLGASILFVVAAAFLAVMLGVANAQPADQPPVVATATEVPAVEVPNPEQDLGGFLQFLISAFTGKDWFVVGGLAVMVVVFLVGKFMKVGNAWLPVVSAAVGMLGGVVTGLLDASTSWYVDLYAGLLTSGQAALFWSLFGKKVFPKKE